MPINERNPLTDNTKDSSIGIDSGYTDQLEKTPDTGITDNVAHKLKSAYMSYVPGARSMYVAGRDKNLTGWQVMGTAFGISPYKEDENFDRTSKEVRDIYKSVPMDSWNVLNDARSMDELVAYQQRIQIEDGQDEVMSDLGFWGSALYMAPFMAADPLNLVGGELFTSMKMFKNAGVLKTGALFGAQNAAISGAQEGIIRAQGSENYETVPYVVGFSAVLGLGAGMAGKMLSNMITPDKQPILENMGKKGQFSDIPKDMLDRPGGIKDMFIEAHERSYTAKESIDFDAEFERINQQIVEAKRAGDEVKEARLLAEESQYRNLQEEGITPVEHIDEYIEPNTVTMDRSTTSKVVGWLFDNPITASPMTRVLNMFGKGEVPDSFAVHMTAYDNPIYTIEKGGKSAAHEVTAVDIKHEQNAVFGLNQAIKYQSYNQYVQAMVENGKKPVSMQEFDSHIAQTYSTLHGEYYNKVADIENDIVKSEEFNKIIEEVKTKLEETKPVTEDGKTIEVPTERVELEVVKQYPEVNDHLTPEEVDLVNAIWEMGGKPKIEFKDIVMAGDGKTKYEVGGRYIHDSGTIELSRRKLNQKGKRGVKGTHAIPHELWHAVFYQAIRKDPESMAKLSDIIEQARAHIGEAASKVYGLKNEDEFISELLSNHDFRSKMESLEYKGTTEAEHSTILERAINVMREAIRKIGRTIANGTSIADAADNVLAKIIKEQGLEDRISIKKEKLPDNQEYVDADYAAAKAEGHEALDEYIQDAVQAEVRRRAEEKAGDPMKILDATKDVEPWVKNAVEADVEYYRYHAKRAKKNGLDRKNTWSTKMYESHIMNKKSIVGDINGAIQTFAGAIRTHRSFYHVIRDMKDDIGNSLDAQVKSMKDAGKHQSAAALSRKIPLINKEIDDLNSAREGKDIFTLARRYGVGINGGSDDVLASKVADSINRVLKKNLEKADGGSDIWMRINKTISSPDQMARDIVKKIESAEKVEDFSIDLSSVTPNFLKRRGLKLNTGYDGLREYMNLGSNNALAVYDYKIKGRQAAMEKFGTTDREEYMAMLEREYKFKDSGKGKKAIKIALDMFDTLIGDKQMPDDPYSWGMNLSRIARKFTYLNTGGAFAKYAISEIGVATAKHGFNNVMAEIPEAARILKDLYKSIKMGENIDISDADFRDLFDMADAWEIFSSQMKSAFSDVSPIDAIITADSKAMSADRKLQELQNIMYRYSGLEGATILTRLAVPRAVMRRMSDVIMKGKNIDKDLKRWGMDAGDTAKIRKELKRIGYDPKKRSDFQFSKWEDKELASKVKRIITKAGQDTIMRHEDLRLPTWMVDGNTLPIFQMTKLFMGFQVMSQERLLMAGMTENKARSMAGMLTTAGIIGMFTIIGETIDVATGKKKPEKATLPWNENAGKFFRQQALMQAYSGMYGQLGEFFGFRNWDGGIMSSKYQSGYRTLTKVAGGAPAAKAFSLLEVTTAAFTGKPTDFKVENGILGFVPFNNIAGLGTATSLAFRKSMEAIE